MFEYLMIDGVNDTSKEAQELADLMNPVRNHARALRAQGAEGRAISNGVKKPLYFVNLITFNPVGHCEFKTSPGWKIKAFKDVLEKFGINVTQRHRFGREIKAACGQLAGTSSEALAKEDGQLAGND